MMNPVERVKELAEQPLDSHGVLGVKYAVTIVAAEIVAEAVRYKAPPSLFIRKAGEWNEEKLALSEDKTSRNPNEAD